MRISRFEDIKAWEAARQLCRTVYSISEAAKFSKDFGLRDQTRRAAVSIMANIAEGFDSHSNPEFAHFLYYALRSASELQSHLYIAHDQGYLTQSQFAEVYEATSQVKRMIFKFIEYLRAASRTYNRKEIDVAPLMHLETSKCNHRGVVYLRTPNVEPTYPQPMVIFFNFELRTSNK